MKKFLLLALAFIAALATSAEAQTIGPPASSGGTPGGSNTQIQYNNSNAFGGVSGWTTNGSNTVTNTQSIGVTSTDGPILANTTAATSGAQQWSPRIRLTGQGWKASGTPASQNTDWIIENQTIAGQNYSAMPTLSKAVFSQQIAAGGYASMFELANSDAYTYNLAGGLMTFTGINKVNVGQASGGGGVNFYSDSTDIFNITTSNNVALPSIATDATHTDTSVCQDTTTHALYFGSGTLGICLGTSSVRYKKDIVAQTDGLAQIMALSAINYHYIEGRGDNGAREQYGFLAEDVVNVLPKLVALDVDGKPNSVDILGMVPVLVKAVQELKANNDNLKQGLAALKSHQSILTRASSE
jgi:hypothetical protein